MMRNTPTNAFDQPGLHVGCDVHPVSTVAQSIEVFGERYLERVFTLVEREQCAGATLIERLAARYAAKEAVLKALRVPADVAIPWSSIEIVSDRDGAPSVRLTGRAAAFAAVQGVSHIEVSMSHDAGVALAFAVAMTRVLSQEAVA
jgi:holo-[acyl-carrier protein] synthase